MRYVPCTPAVTVALLSLVLLLRAPYGAGSTLAADPGTASSLVWDQMVCAGGASPAVLPPSKTDDTDAITARRPRLSTDAFTTLMQTPTNNLTEMEWRQLQSMSIAETSVQCIAEGAGGIVKSVYSLFQSLTDSDAPSSSEKRSLCEQVVARVINMASSSCNLQTVCTQLSGRPVVCGAVFTAMCIMADGDTSWGNPCQWILDHASSGICNSISSQMDRMETDLSSLSERNQPSNPGYFPCVGSDVCEGAGNRASSSFCHNGVCRSTTLCCHSGYFTSVIQINGESSATCSVEQSCPAPTPTPVPPPPPPPP